MAETKTMRLSKVLREFNISLDRAVEFLGSKGYEVEARPTTKISGEEYEALFEEFQTDKSKKVASKEVGEEKRKDKEELRLQRERELEEKEQKAQPMTEQQPTRQKQQVSVKKGKRKRRIKKKGLSLDKRSKAE